jgi:hypothetical protein
MPIDPGTTIEVLWRDFMRKVGLEAAPEVQRVEMRRAFYAGFAMGIETASAISAHTPDDNLDAGADKLQALANEYTAFFARGGM